MIERLAAGESDALEPALVFLEADPWCFRSGYAKERIAELLSRHHPDLGQQARIERVLLHVVDVGDRPEFRRHQFRLLPHTYAYRVIVPLLAWRIVYMSPFWECVVRT